MNNKSVLKSFLKQSRAMLNGKKDFIFLNCNYPEDFH